VRFPYRHHGVEMRRRESRHRGSKCPTAFLGSFSVASRPGNNTSGVTTMPNSGNGARRLRVQARQYPLCTPALLFPTAFRRRPLRRRSCHLLAASHRRGRSMRRTTPASWSAIITAMHWPMFARPGHRARTPLTERISTLYQARQCESVNQKIEHRPVRMSHIAGRIQSISATPSNLTR
jgi:hypothetical protein